MPVHTVPFPTSIERVAYHEAGHLVVTYKLTGLIAGSIDLSLDDSEYWAGSSQPDPNPEYKISVKPDAMGNMLPATADSWTATIAGLLAGRDAVAEAFRLKKIALPFETFENYPGEAGFVAMPGITTKTDDCSLIETFAGAAVASTHFRSLTEVIMVADALSRRTIDENWHTVEKVASNLISKTKLSRLECENLL